MSIDDPMVAVGRSSRATRSADSLREVLGSVGRDIQVWPASTEAVDVASQVDHIAALGAQVVVVGPELALADACWWPRRSDERQPGISSVLVASRSADMLERALRAGAPGILDPDRDRRADSRTHRRGTGSGPAPVLNTWVSTLCPGHSTEWSRSCPPKVVWQDNRLDQPGDRAGARISSRGRDRRH
ncbi:MAG: hypothetical protein R2706_18050 [Acidimicrobiales bacterium]